MPGPTLLIAGPLVAALAALLLRRWSLPATAAGVALLLATRVLLSSLTLDGAADGFFQGDTWIVVGRSLVLTEATRQALLLLYDGLLLLMLLSLATPQGRHFAPAALALPAPLAAALLAEPFIYGVAALLVSAGLLVVLIQARAGSTQGALRFLTMSVLAAPFLLVAGWMVESEQALFATAVGRLLLIATIMLLAGFPFQLWVNPVLRSAPPYVAALLFGLAQLLIALFLLRLLEANTTAVAQGEFNVLVHWSAAATAVLGALWLWRSRDLEGLLGGLILVDTAVLLLVFGEPAGASAALTVLYLRFVSLTLTGAGIGLLRRHARSPLGLVLFSYGALSLAGVPFTPGFSGRLLVLNDQISNEPLFALAALLAIGVAVMSVARVVRLQAPEGWLWPDWVWQDGISWRDRAGWQRLGGVLLLAGALIIAFVPALVIDPLRQLAASM